MNESSSVLLNFHVDIIKIAGGSELHALPCRCPMPADQCPALTVNAHCQNFLCMQPLPTAKRLSARSTEPASKQWVLDTYIYNEQHLNCQLPTANCQLPTANCQLPLNYGKRSPNR
jgi:hypothetical protein